MTIESEQECPNCGGVEGAATLKEPVPLVGTEELSWSLCHVCGGTGRIDTMENKE